MVILDSDGMKPIYVQIADWLENQILSEKIRADEKIYSQYQLAEMFQINPATAAKGLNLLADEDILYKKRGLGMFVTNDAHGRIILKRKNQTMRKLVMDLVTEAERLGVTEDEVIDMVKEIHRKKGEER